MANKILADLATATRELLNFLDEQDVMDEHDGNHEDHWRSGEFQQLIDRARDAVDKVKKAKT